MTTRIPGSGMMSDAKIPGCVTYISGVNDISPPFEDPFFAPRDFELSKNEAEARCVEGSLEVSARRSMIRFELS